MTGTLFVWFRIAIFCVAAINVIIIIHLKGSNLSMSVAKSLPETHWSWSQESQSEVYQNIQGDNNLLLLPLTNGSINVYIDLKKYRQEVRNRNHSCSKIKGDPASLFRSQPASTNFTAEWDRKQIMLAFMCGGTLYPDYLTAQPREKLYPFEAFYLYDPPLWNESSVACHNYSTISLVNVSNKFVVGDTVSFLITMYDKLGRRTRKGGDRIQVWLKDVTFQNSISAKTTDFNNGTYLATTVLPWVGTVRVMATLRQPREYFRALAYVHRALKTTIPFAGAYSNSKANECAPCNPFPIVPGFDKSELCNLTSLNGSPWYCGRPRKPELNCSDYSLVSYSNRLIDMPVTPAEDRLLKQPGHQRNFLRGNISLVVESPKPGITRMKDPDVPCNQVSPRSTWHQAVPDGYFYNNVWKSFLCYMPANVNDSCFKNLHIIFYGDSNSREGYYNVLKKIPCKENVFGKKQINHAPKACVNATYNFTTQHLSHESPFHAAANNFRNKSWLHSPERLFGSIPSTGRHIIVTDHYMHFTTYHTSVYERALTAVRDAVVKLLQRNPQVLIIIKGPHVAEHIQYSYLLGDAWAQYYIVILRKTFRDLQDRVLYLPTWDMTVASGDIQIHPSCNRQIADVILHFICGRHTLS